MTEPQPELVPGTDPDELTLEHVLPEHPAKAAWSGFNEDDRKAYTKRLGNMVLLKQKMNSKLRSSSFTEKREIYAKSNLLLTQRVAEFKKWNKKAIDEHQAFLAKLAVKAWKIKL
jgi:hypothetical protein